MNMLLKQKLAGLAFIILGILSVPACDMDATIAVLFIPFGLFLVFGSEVYIDTTAWDELED